MFWNLLSNAQKFTPTGTVTVTSDDAAGGRIRIDIADTGVGIDPQVLPRLFNAFEQGGPSTTRTFGGLGLGLAICKALVEAHGGSLTAHSEGVGRGATFTVELPTVDPAMDAGPSVPTSSSGPTAPTGLRVLLVDDHAATLDMLARLLKRLGHAVVKAESYAAAMAAAEEGVFDLILSDVGLPDGSGLDVMRSMRARYPDLKGICLSGYGMDEDVRRSLDAGFDAHLTKPVDLLKLQEVIRKVSGT